MTMVMRAGYRFLLLLCALAVAPALAAQELKVGFVDTARLLKEAPQAEAARKKLESEFAPRDQKIVDMQTELKSLDDKQERTTQKIGESQRRQLERQIVSLRRDIKRAKEEFYEDLNIRRNEELAKLKEQIDKVVEALAREQEYDLIFSDYVEFASKRVDITDNVLEKLRSEFDGSAGAAGTKKE
jgi:outer membrane protein